MNNRKVAAEKRQRTEASCDICRARKQKCDKSAPQKLCRYCRTHGLHCTNQRPRKQRLYGSFEGLATRINLLESLVKGLVPEADLSGNNELRRIGASLGIPLPDESTRDVTPDPEARDSNVAGNDETLQLLPDQQGQVQYTGPDSSFSFHLNSRSLFGTYSTYEFTLFGKNPAEQTEDDRVEEAASFQLGQLPYPGHTSPYTTIESSLETWPGLVVDIPLFRDLINCFFEHVHADFPVLHEVTFRAAYESWSTAPSLSDKVWISSLLCVFLLASKWTTASNLNEQERVWWRKTQALLPAVLFTSSVGAIQALMLLALHLHNTNHRDACWNLTGAVIRISHAIGLHNDDIKANQPLLNRELRKSLWWSIFAFEQLQISSYDRPSAIDALHCSVGSPEERIFGMGAYYPPGLMSASNRLTLLLAAACRVRKLPSTLLGSDGIIGPLSPVLGALRDLQRWKAGLPRHLELQAAQVTAPCHVRSIVMLEVQFHYCTIILTRAALLRRAVSLSKEFDSSSRDGLRAMSDLCQNSGRALSRALLVLNSNGVFNPFTWLDFFYGVTAALILVLDIICAARQQQDTDESMQLLNCIASVANAKLETCNVSGTLRKWASLMTELAVMAQRYLAYQSGASITDRQHLYAERNTQALMSSRGSHTSHGQSLQPGPADANISAHTLANQSGSFFAPMTSAADVAGNAPEWHWEDIEAMLNP